MRPTSLVLAAILTAFATTPAEAQIRASIKIGPIRIGANVPIFSQRGGPRHYTVRSYSSSRHGRWRDTARHWRPISLYLHGGRYYERPYRDSRRVTVYRYRDQYFRAPGGSDWNRSRSRYQRDYWQRDGRDGRRNDRYDRRDDRRDNRTDRRDDRRDDRVDRRDDRRDDRGNRGGGRGNGGRRN